MDRRHKELGDFLRTRRERLTPEAAGLSPRKRRRTPGLRREEVAEMAGIGAGWYTFLEQGRDVRPSEAVLRRIAKALQLEPAEVNYLLNLALECPLECRSPRTGGESVVTPALRGVLQSMTDRPALIYSPRWDILAYNEAANALYDIDYSPHHVRNRLRYVFTPVARGLHPNWEQVARQYLTTFRTQNASLLRDRWLMRFVDELKEASPTFGDWWAEQSVGAMESAHVQYDHPFVGHLELDVSMLEPLDSHHGPQVRLALGCCDEKARQRLEDLIRQHRVGQQSSSCNIWTILGVQDIGSCTAVDVPSTDAVRLLTSRPAAQ
jgi:transcriptional regulator with XRE-family HTH domain